MNEEWIERRVELAMDSLDRRLMSGVLTQSEYDAETRRLARWADSQYAKLAALRGRFAYRMRGVDA